MASSSLRLRKGPCQSALDTSGGFSRPWSQTLNTTTSPRGTAPTVDPGWITMIFVMVTITITTTLARDATGYSSTGLRFADVVVARLSALASDASHVLLSGLILTSSFVAFALATRFAVARTAFALPFNLGLSLLLFEGPVWFIRYSTVAAAWPWLQRISLLMYATVLSMKLYSFGVESARIARGLEVEPADETDAASGMIDGRVWTRTQPQPFPECASLASITHFLVRPSLVFTNVTLRLESTSVSYLLEKAMMVGGTVLLALDLVDRFVVPAWRSDLPLWLCVGEIAPSMTIVMMCCFYATFECICNACAEAAQVAERRHYGPWWASTSFVDFSRNWNAPVGAWLKTYIYQSTHLGQAASLVATFGVSIILHEIILWASLGPRYSYPFLAAATLCQFPLAPLLKTRPFKGTRLGNVFVWTGLSIGIALVTTLYARGGGK
jgi:hypothetical protein